LHQYQLKYNIWVKFIDIDAIKYCQDHDIMVIAYKPFARGRIITEKIELLSTLSKKYAKTDAQIVLNWLVSKKNTVALFKSTNTTHLKENLDIFDFRLTDDETKQIDSLVQN
jgi:diketogulonate reductase-like aldo/keto reductase